MSFIVGALGEAISLGTNISAAAAVPTLASAGFDIGKLRGTAGRKSGGLYALLRLWKESGAITLVAPSLYGYRADWEGTNQGWSLVADLRAGLSIIASNGYTEVLMNLALYDRALIVPASVSGGGAFNAALYPIEIAG